MQLVELAHFAVRAPADVAAPGVSQVEARDLLEPAPRVEACGQLIGERLVVHEAVCAGRADRLFVEALRIELAPVEACDLRAHQRGAVLEVLRAGVGPLLEQTVVPGECIEVLPPLCPQRLPRTPRRAQAQRRNGTPPARNSDPEAHISALRMG